MFLELQLQSEAICSNMLLDSVQNETLKVTTQTEGYQIITISTSYTDKDSNVMKESRITIHHRHQKGLRLSN